MASWVMATSARGVERAIQQNPDMELGGGIHPPCAGNRCHIADRRRGGAAR